MRNRPRKAMALVSHLPANSAIVTDANGGVVWTEDTELLAVQIEVMFAMIRILLQGFGAKKHQIPKPVSIDRPWDRVRAAGPKRKATAQETVDILAALMKGPANG